ncbi:hypothetical protein K466DRAFT_599376 [Polyporus arcularius HHB13444]|uniref:Eukaryotic translation initiation factor 4G1 eIF4E-binding domain-containing protein n=1 Tax=Polyporus arcularius HHB13444 TaxID=1314778 RepID=A0A5C3PCX4_9APHY|nr:hypothetical protein K466DRAFT_599376 [Polyporus arcularius HHB13444]
MSTTFAGALRSPAGYDWRFGRSSLSGGVKCSMVTDQRSKPPSFWEPRPPGSLPPQDTSDNPVLSSAGDALRARAVQQSLADPGPALEGRLATSPLERRSASQSLPQTPVSDRSATQTHATPRSASLPTSKGSPGNLNVKANEFVPGTVVVPMAEIDLNDYMKLAAPTCSSSRQQPSGAPPPVENWTPSDEEDVEKQWQEQARLHMKDGSAILHFTPGTAEAGPSGRKAGVETTSVETRRNLSLSHGSHPLLQRVQVESALSFVGLALSRAKPLEDLDTVSYPATIRRVDPTINRDATHGRFRYDREFLLQFQDVCKMKPASSPQADVRVLERIYYGSERPPSDITSWPKSRRKPRPSPAARVVGLAFGTAQAVAGSDDVRIAPSAVPLAEGHGIATRPRVPSPGSEFTCDSPTIAGTTTEGSESYLTAHDPDSVDNSRAGKSIDEKQREARVDELEKRVAFLVREVESLRGEIKQLRAHLPGW